MTRKTRLTTAGRLLALLAIAVALVAACSQISTMISERVSVSRTSRTGGYSFSEGGVEAVHKDEGPLAATMKRLVIRHRFGAVTVVSAEGKPGWKWELRCRAETQARAERFAEEEVKLAFKTEGETLTLLLELPPAPAPELKGLDSRLTLMVPKAVAVELTNGFGPTRVSAVTGGVELASEYGAVELDHIGGPLKARTSFARLRARSLGGEARLTNEHGAIDVSGVAGALIAETSFGALTAREVKGGARLINEHGAIQAGAIQGRLEAQTSFGPITLDGALCREIKARNEHGAISLSIGDAARAVDAATNFGVLELTGLGQRPCRFRAETSFGALTPPPGLAVTGNSFTKKCQGDTGEAAELTITLANEHGAITVK